MFENVQQVFYNSAENKHSGLVWHTTHALCDDVLFEFITSKCDKQNPVVIINYQAVLPDFWQQRLLQPMIDDHQVNCITALTTDIFELSPIPDGGFFYGDEKTLDHEIFILQTHQVFCVPKINTHAFAVRNVSHLTQPEAVYACNNLLINLPCDEQTIAGAKAPEIGDQTPLPAHPLAELHWFFIQNPHSISEPRQGYPVLNQQPSVLHVVMDWGGGVQKWLDEFIENQPEYNHYVLVSHGELFRQRYGEKLKLYWQSPTGICVDEFHLSCPIESTVVNHPEYKAILNKILSNYDIQVVVVSSVIGHSLDCLDTGLPTLRVLHDYFPHWPSLRAELDEKPISEDVLNQALNNCKDEPFGHITKEQLKTWQQANNKLLSQTNIKIVAPDQSVITNLLKLDNSACYKKAQVIPHGVPPLTALDYQSNAAVFKVLVLGRVNKPKGEDLLYQCIEGLANDSSIQFILLGAGDSGAKFKKYKNTKVIKHFAHEELSQLVAEYDPQLALLSSVASETFSFTLSELQMLGLPVLATRVGALKNRIEDGQTGILVEKDGQEMAKKIQVLKSKPELLQAISHKAKNVKHVDLHTNSKQFSELLSSFELNSQPAYSTQGLITPKPFVQYSIQLTNQNSHLLDRIELLESNLTDKTNWAIDLSKQVKHLEHNLSLERSEITYLKESISSLQESHKAETDELKTTINQLNEKLSLAFEELSQLNVTYTETKSQLDAMLGSRSWRVTKPLRTFTTWVRHKRNAIKFRFNQLKGIPKRVNNSLKTRGFKETAKIATNKLKKPNTKPQPIEVHEIKETYAPISIASSTTPKVSVIIPVYNQYKHTYHCLESLARLQDSTTFEVIVVNDCSTDNTAEQLQKITGITAHTQAKNGGFIESCNSGANLAKGEYLLFLNNDTEVLPRWLDSLLETFESYSDAGLVGSQLIYPDGRLQEAGGIVFADASGWNYGRFDAPDHPEYQHVREVSYCSGASIMIKRDLFNQLGQFDQRYKPAYYEDTDLAFAVRKEGLKVYYQPASKIIHFEGISSGTDLSSGTKKYQVINQQKFLEKWQDKLKKQPKPGTDIEVACFQNNPRRVLIMDACTPTPDQDSGSLRMLNLMQIFNELGYQVSFIPENMAHFEQYTSNLQQLGVECVYAPKYNTPIDYLKSKGKLFDLVILSRYYVAKPVISAVHSYCVNAKIWFDTVDLHYLREQRMAEVAGDETMIKAANNTKQQELAIATGSDLTLVVSPYEQEILAKEMPDLQVDVLSNIHEVYGNQKSYSERKDIMFIGGYQHTPNVDGILWFVENIFPDIIQVLPDLKLHIIGSKAPKQVVSLGKNPNIEFHGFVEDIEPFMQNIRIAVAPLRFGAGVKGKVNMSMSYGQPVVGTKVAVEGMYTTHKHDVMMADKPTDFAEAVIQLYQDEVLWNQVSEGGLANVERWFSFNAAKQQIKKLLNK